MQVKAIAVAAAVVACGGSQPSVSSVRLDAPARPALAERRPVTDSHHGVEVSEDYRWLENADDPDVRSWSDAQNTYARAYLSALPGIDAVRARVTEVLAAEVVSHSDASVAGGQVFALREQPPRQQPLLVVMPSANEPGVARVVVDPEAIDAEGFTTIDFYAPSPDGALVAVSLSRGGTESGDVQVFDVATGEPVHEVIPRVNGGTAGGAVAWAPDGSGLFYTRYPRAGERPEADLPFYMQVYYHHLGTPTEQDRYEIGKDFPRIAEIQLDMHPASGRLIATVQNGDGGEIAHYLRATDGAWSQLSRFGDGIVQLVFGPNDDLFVVSFHDAPRGKILRMPIESPDVSQATLVVAESDDTIVADFWVRPTILATESRLYVTYQLGGPSQIRAFDLSGKPVANPEQLEVASVGPLAWDGKGDVVMFSQTSFVQPTAYYRFDPRTGLTSPTKLATPPTIDTTGVRVVRELATSKDGTRVPVNILIPPGLELDGTTPCIVSGYGGYGVNIEPSYRASKLLAVERGIIYAIANLRGGGEFGEDWHRQGMLTNKQNVFDDFAAVLQHMIDRRYTSSERLAIIGGSNGGLLMGAMLTQHPQLVKAVVSYVGIYDMLRVELSPNGAFNVTEFGTVTKPDHFRAIRAYSPYHNVREGTRYPPTLLLTGANDPRVEPWHSRKMAAAMQAADSAGLVLLRTSDTSGHGGGMRLDESVEERAHVDAFLYRQLGVKID